MARSEGYETLQELGWNMQFDVTEPEPVEPLELLDKDAFEYPVIMDADRTGVIEVKSGLVDLSEHR